MHGLLLRNWRFYDNSDDDYRKSARIFNTFFYGDTEISNVPINLSSLWESNAFIDECLVHYEYIYNLDSEYDQKIEMKRLDKIIGNWMFDSELINYTNVYHLVKRTIHYASTYTMMRFTQVFRRYH